ncbi:hypothetical protein [Natrinema ejinorense]|uniref:Uncharacterized protein n=1 Tax=Natrinema ejinorense TaxID=373386 RepID=A0A2A5QRA1_9EURY|nr:hypothetical protein [Natrinema ejinorense]PCR89325.1 hypothetical protein CP557_01490 [Natrinema ejinorense]
MDISQYSQQELARLKLGYIVRERQQSQQSQQRTGTRMSARKRDLQRGQQQARREMFDDLGVTA